MKKEDVSFSYWISNSLTDSDKDKRKEEKRDEKKEQAKKEVKGKDEGKIVEKTKEKEKKVEEKTSGGIGGKSSVIRNDHDNKNDERHAGKAGRSPDSKERK